MLRGADGGGEGFEEVSIGFAYLDSVFGVPLDSDDECSVGAFQAFDDSVGRNGRNDEAFAYSIGCLVVA